VIGSDADSDGTAEEYTVTYTLKSGVTSTNKRTVVPEGSRYTTTLKGVEAGDTVTVTMGGSAVAGAYSAGKVTIASVTGNIVITVAAGA
jgi:hypothetical protein